MEAKLEWTPAIVSLVFLYLLHSFHPTACQETEESEAVEPLKSYENISSLLKTLMGSQSGYNVDLRPIDDQSKMMRVFVLFTLLSVVRVDNVNQELTVNGFLVLIWTDERLHWYPDEHGIPYISPQPKDIWRPRLQFMNTLGDRDVFKDDSSPVFVYADGSAYWLPGGLLKGSCNLKMDKYPFDVQKCAMVFCPLSYFNSLMTLEETQKEFDLRFYNPNDEWDLVKTSINTSTIHAGISGDVYSCIELHFQLKREPSFYILNIILPVLLISFLNNFVFMIPEESGEKIGYAITVLLSLSVFLTTVSTQIPKASKTTPAVTIYLFSHLLSSVLTTLVCMATVYLYNADVSEENHIQAETNYKTAVKKVWAIKNFVSKVDVRNDRPDTEMRRRPASFTDASSDVFKNVDSKNFTDPRPNRYRLIGKHINKFCFVIGMVIWVTINMAYFIFVLT